MEGFAFAFCEHGSAPSLRLGRTFGRTFGRRGSIGVVVSVSVSSFLGEDWLEECGRTGGCG